MNSWSQNQPNNMIMGQAQFNPYQQGWGNYMPQKLPTYSATPIHGQNAAWQFPMGANSEIYLPDADQDIIWWIRTDSNGNRSVQAFDVTPHKDPEPVDIDNIIARLGAVEEWINAKSNKSNTKRNTTATNVASTTIPVSGGAVQSVD